MIKPFMKSVRAFNEAAGNITEPRPYFPHWDVRMLQISLLAEEFQEYLNAEDDNDMVKVADGLGDLMVVIAGTALRYGIDLDGVLEEICRSNMTKVVNGEVIKSAQGKILKPLGYEAPNIKAVLWPEV